MTADKSEFVTQIWLATTDGKENFQLTFNDKSSTNPKWSPDGNWIAFTSNRKDNKNNLYLLRLSGGEAEPLTDVKTAVSNFEWSPDGHWIAFTMADAKTEDEEKNDKAQNDFRWVDENLKMARLVRDSGSEGRERQTRAAQADDRKLQRRRLRLVARRNAHSLQSHQVAGRERLDHLGCFDRRSRERQGHSLRQHAGGGRLCRRFRLTANGSR